MFARGPRGWRRLIRQRVIVNLRSGGSFAGVLTHVTRDLVELSGLDGRGPAWYGEGDAPPVHYDHPAFVERSNVSHFGLDKPSPLSPDKE